MCGSITQKLFVMIRYIFYLANGSTLMCAWENEVLHEPNYFVAYSSLVFLIPSQNIDPYYYIYILKSWMYMQFASQKLYITSGT